MPQRRRPARASVLRLVAKGGVLRARDARTPGVHTRTLTRMVRAGELERLGPGRYRQASANISENHSLALACGAVPSGMVCLLSALRFHNIGTQMPREGWVAVPGGTRVPRLSYP